MAGEHAGTACKKRLAPRNDGEPPEGGSSASNNWSD